MRKEHGFVPEYEASRQRVAVIGLGNIGESLRQHRGNAELTALSRSKVKDKEGFKKVLSGVDLLHPESVEAAVRKLKLNGVDTVINATSYRANMDQIEREYQQGQFDAARLHVEGSRNLARALAKVGIGMIQISTDAAVWEKEEEGSAPRKVAAISPFDIDRDKITSEYGRTKGDAEKAVLEEHPDAVIVRLGQVNTANGGLMPLTIRKMLAGEELTVQEDQNVSLLRDETVAKSLYAIEKAMTAAKKRGETLASRIIHVAATNTMTTEAIAKRIGERYFAGDPSLVKTSAGLVPGQEVERPKRTNLDVSDSFFPLPTVEEEVDAFIEAHGGRMYQEYNAAMAAGTESYQLVDRVRVHKIGRHVLPGIYEPSVEQIERGMKQPDHRKRRQSIGAALAGVSLFGALVVFSALDKNSEESQSASQSTEQTVDVPLVHSSDVEAFNFQFSNQIQSEMLMLGVDKVQIGQGVVTTDQYSSTVTVDSALNEEPAYNFHYVKQASDTTTEVIESGVTSSVDGQELSSFTISHTNLANGTIIWSIIVGKRGKDMDEYTKYTNDPFVKTDGDFRIHNPKGKSQFRSRVLRLTTNRYTDLRKNGQQFFADALSRKNVTKVDLNAQL